MTDSLARDGESDGQGRGAASVAGEHVGEVAAAAREQARGVADDARAQVRGIARSAQERVNEQAVTASERAAEALRTAADRFGALAAGDPGAAGPFAGYANDIRVRVGDLAARLEGGPDVVLDDVRRFARRRPGLFLAGAGLSGFVVGRMMMGARDAESQHDSGAVYASGDRGSFPAPSAVGRSQGAPSAMSPSAMSSSVRASSEGAVAPAVDRQGLPLREGIDS